MPQNFPTFSELFPLDSFPGVQQWRQKEPPIACFRGVAGSAGSVLAASLFAATRRTVLVFVDSARQAEVLAQECRSLLDRDSVLVFPSRDAVPYNLKSPFGPTVEARLQVLSTLLKKKEMLVVAPAEVLLQQLPPPAVLLERIIHLRIGIELPPEQLTARLTAIGFRREAATTDVGSFSIRGCIFDIYPFLSDNPLRLEYFGDTIESIREFDVFTQRSVRQRSDATIFPMKELIVEESEIRQGLNRMARHCDASAGDRVALNRLRHRWCELGDPDGIEWYVGWFSVSQVSLWEYAPSDAIVLWNDPIAPATRFLRCLENYQRHFYRIGEETRALLTAPEQILISVPLACEGLRSRSCIFVDTPGHGGLEYSCAMQEQPATPPRIESIVADVRGAHEHGYTIIAASPNTGNAQRLWDLIGEDCPFVKICLGFLRRGFIDTQTRRVVYSETQLFNRPLYSPPPLRRAKVGTPIPRFDALIPGDFVVHVDHGIGRFVGIHRIKAGEAERDCIVVQFAERARLYVPVEDLSKLQKYRAKEGVVPALSRLGSGAWERLKQRTRDGLKEVVSGLISLYAKRRFLPGIAFPLDSALQYEFEQAFPFEETPDQHQAILDVKHDMEADRPMDRLICGDVGFGKTEVAMRAALKAVLGGYQTAVLVPTTVLAMQHYTTFSERMAGFPVRVEVLSRFVSPALQRTIIKGLKNGTVDIVIGTHRLLSADVSFKKLGLLIIDEEQKFGVRHKERLKQLRSTVDVLALTATPIPRTLQLSLMEARDLSVINTPPRNRLPVETVVTEYHEDLVKSALEHELERGGQVYYVYNRVKDLPLIFQRLEQMVPRARIAVAHGQMKERELEDVMAAFIAGRYDVLLSTVIIENGLDIANVNTLIVHRADLMGLAQLYQLRGRVGRSSEQAFAYLLTPPFNEIGESALRRLRALEQYTELGSGFQIAMRDLEIRGAGTILGTRQHGFIASVGFEMYLRLLKEAMAELKGEKPEVDRNADAAIEAPVQAFIPADYISDGGIRLAVYQDLAEAGSRAELDEIQLSIADRFGPLPLEVKALLSVMRLKIYARTLGCVRVTIDDDATLTLQMRPADSDELKTRVTTIISRSPMAFEVKYGNPLLLKTTLKSTHARQRLEEAVGLLDKLVQKNGDA